MWDEELTYNKNEHGGSRDEQTVMILSKERKTLNIKFGNHNIKQSDQFKYLDVMFEMENDNLLSKYNSTFNLLYPLLKD